MPIAALARRSLAPPAYLRLARLGPEPAAARVGSPGPVSKISIVIPTQRRLRGLATAGRSAIRQTGVDPRRLELVIVDNDARPSAEPIAAALAAAAPFPVRYVHEPAAGVANARNAGLAAAEGALIAFLDDDEEAEPGWLAALIDAQARLDADVVFGPVRARAPARLGDHRAYLEAFFSREGPPASGLIDHYYGCGDSLIRRAALPHPTAPFCPSRNRTGGEDDQLFCRMQASGARFAWAADAIVHEDPAPERLTLSYALARAFAYGQGPTRACAMKTRPDIVGIAAWTCVGLAQALVFGLVAARRWLARHPERAFALDRAARGLGKVFWWGPFRLAFYGRGPEKARSRSHMLGAGPVPSEIAVG